MTPPPPAGIDLTRLGLGHLRAAQSGVNALLIPTWCSPASAQIAPAATRYEEPCKGARVLPRWGEYVETLRKYRAVLLGLSLCLVHTASLAAVPKRAGECAFTKIRAVGKRLHDVKTKRDLKGSGSAVLLKNGIVQESYHYVLALERSRAGDPVLTCLVKIPMDCPAGDNRGKLFTTTNLRTEQSWTMQDSVHVCGGA